MAIPPILENTMNRDTLINQLRPRFSNDREWSEFLDFIEDRKVRGGADELWLQWDIHRLTQQAGHQPWRRHDHRFLPEAIRLPEAPIL